MVLEIIAMSVNNTPLRYFHSSIKYEKPYLKNDLNSSKNIIISIVKITLKLGY